MDFEKLCAERYSLRKYADRPVEAEKLEKVLEAGLYCRFLKRVSPKKENGDFVLYSFIANSASFWVGYYLATVLPGIF